MILSPSISRKCHPVFRNNALTISETAHRPNRAGEYILDHERKHAEISSGFWNQQLNAINTLEGKYCSRKCAKIASALANAINLWMKNRMNYNQRMFHINDSPTYKRHPDYMNEEREKARMYDRNVRKYRKLIDDLQLQYGNEGCKPA